MGVNLNSNWRRRHLPVFPIKGGLCHNALHPCFYTKNQKLLPCSQKLDFLLRVWNDSSSNWRVLPQLVSRIKVSDR
ncbi:hypothetical protein RchiOBHm_Chr6g0297151 [Rosa chinensis]|uniref:Uncharacterized protein n=1 Tax=Rosa chinensis TaxID=74649 RepID=A0A2P6PXM4_ROSCH|nr:hypothetical protein RchiOBHm_Chr7g0216721 [Rosa chinensis]PRQ26669.1 hypothetical protein RchiOBHm_Chr6g0297151 [Rosa chinensis]